MLIKQDRSGSITNPRAITGTKPKATLNKRFKSREEERQELIEEMEKDRKASSSSSSSSDEERKKFQSLGNDSQEEEDLIDDLDLFTVQERHDEEFKLTPDQLSQLSKLTGESEESLSALGRTELRLLASEAVRRRREVRRAGGRLLPEEEAELEASMRREEEEKRRETEEKRARARRAAEEREARRAEELAKIDRSRQLLVERDLRARANR